MNAIIDGLSALFNKRYVNIRADRSAPCDLCELPNCHKVITVDIVGSGSSRDFRFCLDCWDSLVELIGKVR